MFDACRLMLKFYAFFNDLIINSKINIFLEGRSLCKQLCSWRMAYCSLYPCSVIPVALTVTKMARKDWNINFKKHLRMHQITLFQDKKSPKIFWGGAQCLPRPSRKGDTPSPHPTPSAPTAPRSSRLWRLIPAPTLSKILDPPLCASVRVALGVTLTSCH